MKYKFSLDISIYKAIADVSHGLNTLKLLPKSPIFLIIEQTLVLLTPCSVLVC